MSSKIRMDNLSLGLTLTAGVGALSYLYYLAKKPKAAAAVDTTHHYILAGDIGGTNSRLALYSTDASSSKHFVLKKYKNEESIQKDQTFLETILQPFLDHCFAQDVLVQRGSTPENSSVTVCLAVAGPVKKNLVLMTNMEHLGEEGLEIDGTKLKEAVGCIVHVKIINDFVGMGYGALTLDHDTEVKELVPNSRDRIDPVGPKVCVGAGTGLGECYLTVNSLNADRGGGYECYPSEGGHVDFSPRDEIQSGLLDFLRKRFESEHRVSVERVVSGRGLANVYEYLCQRYPERIDPEAHKAIEAVEDRKGNVISEDSMKDNGDAKTISLTRETMNIFVSAYGAEVGGAAIKFIPTGGLYIVGGLTENNMKYIEGEDSLFMKAYRDKGRVSKVLDDIPLFVVLNEDLGLRGARVCAQREYNSLY